MSFIKQVALPTPLRLDSLMSHHDSLAGGGHLRIDKVKSSLIQKYYWPKMHRDRGLVTVANVPKQQIILQNPQ